jgi:APA family basic amino acid/polyamine antiporter
MSSDSKNPDPEDVPVPPPASRRLGGFHTTLLVMGGIIGSGIFYAPHRVALAVSSPGAALGLWVAGGAVALAGAFVFAELGGLFPRTGGQYVYLREAFGPWVSFLYGWCLLSMIASGAIVVVAGIGVAHLETALRLWSGREDIALGDTTRALLSALLIVGFALLNAVGLRFGAVVHSVILCVKAGGIAVIAIAGLVVTVEPRSAAASLGSETAWMAAVFAVLFSLGGWQNVAAIAGEIHDARRALPRAIIRGTVLVVALYVGLEIALSRVLGFDGLRGDATPVASAAGRIFGGAGEAIVALLVFVSTVGIVQALSLMTPRIFVAMAEDGVLFRSLAWRHPVRGTPVVAIGAQAAFALLHLTLAWIASTQGADEGELAILDIGGTLDALVFVDWAFLALAGAALFVFRRRNREGDRPFRVPLYPFLPAFFVFAGASVVVGSVVSVDPVRLLPAAVVIGIGLLIRARSG